MAKKKLTYETAYAELQEILSALQSEEANIDELASGLKRAKELVEFCREKLLVVETELQEIIDEEED